MNQIDRDTLSDVISKKDTKWKVTFPSFFQMPFSGKALSCRDTLSNIYCHCFILPDAIPRLRAKYATTLTFIVINRHSQGFRSIGQLHLVAPVTGFLSPFYFLAPPPKNVAMPLAGSQFYSEARTNHLSPA
ncbi:hypothetical protein NPIL_91641 [Nephila pilipes]|uniref:Uncharacterized protein n=1 Tax=Nephila pilipes TaxID=299642 RepID=A0A8X6NVS7_NEPPI|nr:hypothetical protein NPIL_91641 [Nephila pilipes]